MSLPDLDLIIDKRGTTGNFQIPMRAVLLVDTFLFTVEFSVMENSRVASYSLVEAQSKTVTAQCMFMCRGGHTTHICTHTLPVSAMSG